MNIGARRVEVVLQNNTNELLTIEGFSTLQGQFRPEYAPKRGAVVEKQGSAKWACESMGDHEGAQGYVRLGSTKGYVHITWLLSYDDASRFEHTVETPAKLACDVYVADEETGSLDARVMLVTLMREGERTRAFAR